MVAPTLANCCLLFSFHVGPLEMGLLGVRLANEPFAIKDPTSGPPVCCSAMLKIRGISALLLQFPNLDNPTIFNATISQQFSETANDEPTKCAT